MDSDDQLVTPSVKLEIDVAEEDPFSRTVHKEQAPSEDQQADDSWIFSDIGTGDAASNGKKGPDKKPVEAQTVGSDTTEASPKSQQPSQKKFFCPCCDISYATSDLMINHIKQSPIKVKTYSCNVCLLDFFVKRDLIDHQRLDHQMAVSKKYKCDECDLDYNYKSQLERHKQIHEDIARKLAANGIIIPRPGKGDLVAKKDQSGEGRFDVSRSQPLSGSHQHETASKTSILRRQLTGDTESAWQQTASKTSILRRQLTGDTESAWQQTASKTSILRCQLTGDKESLWQQTGSKTSILRHQLTGDKESAWQQTASKTSILRRQLTDDTESAWIKSDHTETKIYADVRKRGKEVAGKHSERKLTPVTKEDSLKLCKPVEISEDDEVDLPDAAAAADECNDPDYSTPVRQSSSAVRCSRKKKADVASLPKVHLVSDTETEMGSEDSESGDCSPPRAKRKRKRNRGTPGHVCDVCSKSFSRASCLTMHTRIHTGHRPYVCDVCSKAFTQAGNLESHKRIHTGDKPFGCDVCSKEFSQACALKKHKMIHTGDKPFLCDVCSKAFILSSCLHRHKRTHTGDKPFVCDVCSKAFAQSSALSVHKLRHIGHKPYVCDVCGKAFTARGHLNRHKRVHTDPFLCGECGMACKVASHLEKHALLTGYKLHICDLCEKAFVTACHLKRHRRIHTGHKPFVCDVCGKAFIQACNLQAHKRTHTGHKPFVCDVCGKGFTQSSNLKAHKRIHTGH